MVCSFSRSVGAQLLLDLTVSVIIVRVNNLKQRAMGSPPYPIRRHSPATKVLCQVARGRRYHHAQSLFEQTNSGVLTDFGACRCRRL